MPRPQPARANRSHWRAPLKHPVLQALFPNRRALTGTDPEAKRHPQEQEHEQAIQSHSEHRQSRRRPGHHRGPARRRQRAGGAPEGQGGHEAAAAGAGARCPKAGGTRPCQGAPQGQGLAAHVRRRQCPRPDHRGLLRSPARGLQRRGRPGRKRSLLRIHPRRPSHQRPGGRSGGRRHGHQRGARRCRSLGRRRGAGRAGLQPAARSPGSGRRGRRCGAGEQ